MFLDIIVTYALRYKFDYNYVWWKAKRKIYAYYNPMGKDSNSKYFKLRNYKRKKLLVDNVFSPVECFVHSSTQQNLLRKRKLEDRIAPIRCL